MNLFRALRLGKSPGVAFTGAGGKTTALFQLARELPPPVIVTATTHLGVNQIRLADKHWIVDTHEKMPAVEANIHGVMLLTGPIDGDRTTGIDKSLYTWLYASNKNQHLPVLIEADGSRQRPLKAPAVYEPLIPEFINNVIVVAGMGGLGKPLSDIYVHRPEIFSLLSGLQIGGTITAEALVNVLNHPEGGLKGIPPGARRVVLLNQADSPDLVTQSKWVAERILTTYQAVIIATLKPPSVERQPLIHNIREPVGGIILAAGEAKRFGKPKQLLPWHGRPLVRHIAETAIKAGLSRVIVVTGAAAEEVEAVIKDLPADAKYNRNWKKGQSTSIKAGIESLPKDTGAAIFLLADQPMVTSELLRALIERHSDDLSPIVAPSVNSRRGNPVLFDHLTFPDLMHLTGDTGGRALFSQYPVTSVPWHDEALFADIDTPEDYARLQA